MTLYMKIGGRSAVSGAMSSLRERLDADPLFELSAFRTDFDRSSDLCEFLVFLFGGAPFYDGKPVSDLLSPLCRCADAYERFVDHLEAVFFGSAGATEDKDDLRAIMANLRPRVLAPKPAAPVLVYSVENEMMRA